MVIMRWQQYCEGGSFQSHCYPVRLAFWTAAVIFAHKSFLQVFVLRKDESKFWKSFDPDGVHMKAWKDAQKLDTTTFWLRQELKESQFASVRSVQVCLELSIFIILGQGALREHSESTQREINQSIKIKIVS